MLLPNKFVLVVGRVDHLSSGGSVTSHNNTSEISEWGLQCGGRVAVVPTQDNGLGYWGNTTISVLCWDI